MTPGTARTAGLVLAAGASRRLGRPKQLVEIDGVSLVVRAVRVVRAAGCAPVVVVTGAHADAVEAALAGEDASCVRHPGWSAGQGTSLAAGIAHLRSDAASSAAAGAAATDPASGEAPGAVLVLLVDQPGIDAAHLDALVDAVATGDVDIAATAYPDGAAGVPACFAARTFDELERLGGDRGARTLIASGRFPVRTVEPAGSTEDLDAPGDADRLAGRS